MAPGSATISKEYNNARRASSTLCVSSNPLKPKPAHNTAAVANLPIILDCSNSRTLTNACEDWPSTLASKVPRHTRSNNWGMSDMRKGHLTHKEA